MSFDRLHDASVRAATFEWLTGQVELHGDVLPRTVLAQGFDLDRRRVPLLGPQGIFKPAVLDEVPLSITTTPNSPYGDRYDSNGLLLYSYRGTDPGHPDNRGMVAAMERQTPLVYFKGVVPGRYVAAWPVFVVRADPARLMFTVAFDDAAHAGLSPERTDATDLVREPADEGRRRYVTAVVRRRLHQRAFRERVLDAYRRECSFCHFRHEELLDAAHIAPDTEPEGEPVVRNGLSLCRMHHAAFDRYFLGVTPDYVVHVRPDLLDEKDGPTLVHAIQALHGQRIAVPRRSEQRPDVHLLAMRYERFRKAATL